MRKLHPLRVQYEAFSNANPFMASIALLAEQIRNNRKPAASDNPFIAMQENLSSQIVSALDGWRDAVEALSERTFMAFYSSPALQAGVGVDPRSTRPLRRAAKSELHRELIERRVAELKSHIPHGGHT